MKDRRIPFEKIPWDKPAKGVAQKVVTHGGKRLRLLRFSDDFIEEDWCMKGHIGLVLAGQMRVDFADESLYYKKGDALWITKGEASKHKAVIEKGKFVEMILFETE